MRRVPNRPNTPFGLVPQTATLLSEPKSTIPVTRHGSDRLDQFGGDTSLPTHTLWANPEQTSAVGTDPQVAAKIS